MEKDWMVLLQTQAQLAKVMETNQMTERFGLALSEQDAELLLKERIQVLKKERRVEFGKGILPQIIEEFCDSDFIHQGNYVDTLIRLQEIFYQYKNEMQDELTDDELLHFMREQFEEICFGDLDYLEGTCLQIFAEAVRAGYRGYQAAEGHGEYGKFDHAQRWDRELYMEALRDLF